MKIVYALFNKPIKKATFFLINAKSLLLFKRKLLFVL